MTRSTHSSNEYYYQLQKGPQIHTLPALRPSRRCLFSISCFLLTPQSILDSFTICLEMKHANYSQEEKLG